MVHGMQSLRNALARWQSLRNGGPWSQADPVQLRHVDRMVLAIVAYCLVWTACGYLLVEPKRSFNPYGLLHLAGTVLTILTACYVVTRLANRPQALTRFTALFTGILSLAVGVSTLACVSLKQSLGDASEWAAWTTWTIWAIWHALFWAATYPVALRTLDIGKRAPLFLALIPVAGIALYDQVPQIPMWYSQPAETAGGATDRSERISVEATYYDQYGLMDDALAKIAKQRPGVPDIYFVGFAGYASQNVFMKEVQAVEKLFDDRFDTTGRSMLLINNRTTVQDTPIANGSNLWYGLSTIGRILDPEEDVLVLFLTSHGSKDRLSVDFWPLQPDDLTASDLREMLDGSGIKWRIIVVSACYSGSFIDDLRTDHSLIITASHEDKKSFGCGNEFDFTYFGGAYFDRALRETFSFSDAFDKAARYIEQRESDEGLTPSQPQIDVGAAIRPKLDELRDRLEQLDKERLAGGDLQRASAPAPTAGNRTVP
jgi:hypothetical protein